jgi:hypothetical protein
MDPIGELARRLPAPDRRWTQRAGSDQELAQGLLVGEVAGVASHDLSNVRSNILGLIAKDPDKLFGLSGLPGEFDLDGILELVGEAAGSAIDPDATGGEVFIEPAPILDQCNRAGVRLARAAERHETVLIATGHPVGLGLLYQEIARLLSSEGVRLLKPAEGKTADTLRPQASIRYNGHVGVLTDDFLALHTHSPEPMSRMLDGPRPDLVIGDHGFAGAAIEQGIDTIGIADINDPALIVAKAQGRTEIVVVMDDNVEPAAYWPCYQAAAFGFASARSGGSTGSDPTL